MPQMLTFLRGAELDPLPPVAFKSPDGRALHIQEDDDLDDEQPPQIGHLGYA